MAATTTTPAPAATGATTGATTGAATGGAPATPTPTRPGAAAAIAAAPAAGAPPGTAAAAGPPSASAAGAPVETTASPRGPRSDPKFAALTADIRTKQHRLAAHPPAGHEARAAQAAARPPANDREAQGKAANAERMNAAQPGEFDKTAFVQAVEAAVSRQAPKNLDEADKFGDSGQSGQITEEVSEQVAAGQQTASAQIAQTTAAAPDTSVAVDKPVVPLAADSPPGVPSAPDPSQAVPDRRPAAATDLSAGPRQVDRQLADAQVSESQLAHSNEPSFTAALRDKHTAEQESAAGQATMRAHEAATLDSAKGQAHQAASGAMAAMAGHRRRSGQQVGSAKVAAKGADEARRAAVATRLNSVFDATKKDVEDILSGLDTKVDDQFTREEKAARDAFVAEHKQKMAEYKDRRYSDVVGKARWVRDFLGGLPDEANQIFVRARDGYVARMRDVIADIADTIATELARAQQRIARGRADLQAEILRLPADLQAIGRRTAASFTAQFDELTQSVNDKGTELVDVLATKYSEALRSVDDEIATEKAKNRGLLAKVQDTVAGAIKTILELKKMLLSLLRKASSAAAMIMMDPIGFLRNLVSAVGAGLRQFLKNIVTHLRSGLVSWLLGVSAQAGLRLPEKFDARGILQIFASLLGLTWSFIRSRIVRKIPERVVSAVETSVSLIVKIREKGIGGLWEEIKEQVGDLKENLFNKITEYLVPTVLTAGVMWILSLLNPASAFVRAVKLIIDIVRFVVERAAQMIEFVNAVLDAVIAIARGGTGGVPALIERALARSIPVLIGLLAAILGLGGIAGKVKSIFQALSKPVAKAVDWIIDKIVTLAKRVWAKLKTGAGKLGKKLLRHDDSPEGKQRRLERAMSFAARALKRFGRNVIRRAVLRPLLAGIKLRYGLTSLELIPDGKTLSLVGTINPTQKRPTDLLVEKSAKEAHEEVIADLGPEIAKFLKGHHNSIEGDKRQSGFPFTWRDEIDRIGYEETGDHSTGVTAPGTGVRKDKTRSKQVGRDNWVPDHQPPVGIVKYGGQMSFRLFPHSRNSSRKQGPYVVQYNRRMTKLRGCKKSKLAEGVKSKWFWPS